MPKSKNSIAPYTEKSRLFERNETGRVRGTDTGTTVLDGLAVQPVSHWLPPTTIATQDYSLRDRELSQVVTNHLRLDLNLVELLSGVDTDDGTNHLGDDNHVSEVGLDEVGLLVGLGLLLGLAELLDEAHRLALQTAVEPSAGAGMDEIAEFLRGEIEEPKYHPIRFQLSSVEVVTENAYWSSSTPR